MRSRAVPLCLLVLLFAASTLPSQAATQSMRQQGLIADANFVFLDAAGCVYTEIAVFAVREGSRSPAGPHVRDSWVNVVLFQYDVCQEEFTVLDYASGFAFLEGAEGSFDLKPGLSTATLEAHVEVSGSSLHSLDLDLVWSSRGPLYHGHQHDSFEFPSGMTIKSQLQGRQRPAQAAGTIVLSGEALETVSNYGNLVATNSRTLWISH